jgi:hypothetical protein
MPRRPALVTQADMERAIRAAKAEGVAELEIRIGRETVLIWRFQSTQSQARSRRLSHIANSACNAGMPRPRPTHLVREFSRHGKAIWYCRRGGRRIRLRAEYGTPEFEAEFQAALHGGTKPEPQRDDRKPGTVAWLIARYRETTVWQQDLSAATRRQRDNIFLHVINNIGDLPVAAITREKVIEGSRQAICEDASPSAQFSRCVARPLPLGTGCGPHQGRSDCRRKKPQA